MGYLVITIMVSIAFYVNLIDTIKRINKNESVTVNTILGCGLLSVIVFLLTIIFG